MRNGKPRDEREESVRDYLLRPMQILAMSEKAAVASETWLENEKGKTRKEKVAETGIVPGIDPVTAVTGIEIGIGTGIGIGIEIGIGIGIVTIGEDHGPDLEIVMDIEDVISIALVQGIDVVPAHAPKSEAIGGVREAEVENVIVNDREAEAVRSVVQRANDLQNRMPPPTMNHLVNTRETELRPIIMLMSLLQHKQTPDIQDMTTKMIKPETDIDMRSFPPIPQLRKKSSSYLLT